ncbi:MAG: extracellular solute-binding protein, partial [Clostridia bacterium]|nr:extracellular solute-binding protein [Clostridia bacterium]
AYPLTSDNGYFMYYDKSVIPESDLDSLEQLIADCENSGKYFAFELQTSAWYLASFFFGTGCKSEWVTDNDGNFTSINDDFDSPNGLIAAKGIEKLVKSPAHISSSQASEFAQGAAIVVTGTWAFEDVKAALGDNMGATDLPSFEVDGQSYHLGSFNGCKLLGVKPQTDAKKSAALHKLAQYLTDETRQMERFETLAWGPANKVDQASEAVQANPGLAALFLQNQYSVPQGQIQDMWWDIAKVIGEEIKNATSEEDLQKALDNYKAKIDGVFATLASADYVFVGAWCDWNNASEDFVMTADGDMLTITLDVPESDYMGGRIVKKGNWDTDLGYAQVTTGADLMKVVDPADNGDNNIIFAAPGNYTVTCNTATGEITITAN